MKLTQFGVRIKTLFEQQILAFTVINVACYQGYSLTRRLHNNVMIQRSNPLYAYQQKQVLIRKHSLTVKVDLNCSTLVGVRTCAGK